jgi:hypothetical protein
MSSMVLLWESIASGKQTRQGQCEESAALSTDVETDFTLYFFIHFIIYFYFYSYFFIYLFFFFGFHGKQGPLGTCQLCLMSIRH